MPEVGITTARAVEILHDRGRGRHASTRAARWSVGSGYLLGGPWVLTAAHVLDYRDCGQPDEQLIVRLPVPLVEAGAVEPGHGAASLRECPATVFAVGDATRDIALLRITTSGFGADLVPARWAQVDQFRPEAVPCWVVGFPRFKERADQAGADGRRRESQQVRGHIDPGSNLVSGLLGLVVGFVPRPLLPGHLAESEWQGMSGAAVFTDGAGEPEKVIGVISDHHRPEGVSSLTVTPVRELLALLTARGDRSARDVCEFFGVSPGGRLPEVRLAANPQLSGGSGVGGLGVEPLPTGAAPKVFEVVPVGLLSETFTGRAELLASLSVALTMRDSVGPSTVVEIVGPPGIGKTALATQAVHRALNGGDFVGGFRFLRVFGYDPTRRATIGTTLAALLRSLGVSPRHIPADDGAKASLFQTELRRRADAGERMLLFLDDVADREHIDNVRPPAPHRLVITSRHSHTTVGRLRLVEVDVLTAAESVELIRAVVLGSRPGDTRLQGDAEPLAGIIDACEGIPLALRIVAAQLAAQPELSLRELHRRLADDAARLMYLEHQDFSVRLALRLSVESLEPSLRAALRLLTLHPARRISVESTRALLDLTEPETIWSVGELRNAHLLRPAGDARWFQMHDLIRLYARQSDDHPINTPADDDAVLRLLEHYAARVADPHPNLAGWLAWCDGERSALVGSCELAESIGRPATAYQLAMGTAQYFRARFLLDDWLTTARIGERASERLDPVHAGRSAVNLGEALWAYRRFDEAVQSFERGARLLGESAPASADAFLAVVGLGTALWAVGKYEESAARLNAAADGAAAAGENLAEALALSALGNSLLEIGDTTAALSCHQRAASLLREAGAIHELAPLLVNLASSSWQSGDGARSVALLDEAIMLLRQINDPFLLALAMTSRANALAGLGELALAIDCHVEAGRIFEDIGDRYGVGRSSQNLGTVLTMDGRVREADEYLSRARTILSQYEHQHGHMIAVIRLGSRPGEGAPAHHHDHEHDRAHEEDGDHG
jgi:tetratricopeptide (TPR) repeat protein/RecA/RadA recombinase